MLSKTLYVLISFLLINNYLTAQSELRFEFDYARFDYDSKNVFMEFYYELNPSGMKLSNSDEGIFAEAVVHIEMKNIEADTFYINRDWKIQSFIGGTEDEPEINVSAGVLGFTIPEGNYSLLVKAYDALNNSYSKTINESISIVPFKTDHFSISDIELASNIKKGDVDPNSIFYKNTLEIIPNPSMVYSNNMPVLFYYAELYNLQSEDPEADFTYKRQLYNSSGMQVNIQEKNIKQSENSLVEYGLINLSKLPTDTYNISMSIIDNKSNQAYVSTKRFYHYNPGVVDSSAIKLLSAGLMGSEFAEFTIEECDKMFSQIKYIATRNEVINYNKLDSLDAKKQFLYNFWKFRDSEPSTPRNEFKDDYMHRVEYANTNFKFMGREGYQTDRGRVYLTYGEPDQRDFFPNQPNLKPYEVWFYNQIEGGVSFYFGDVTGFGNYELLHSNKRGEVRDDNWESRIRTQ